MVLVNIDKDRNVYLYILLVSGHYKVQNIPVYGHMVRFVEDLVPHAGIQLQGSPRDPEASVLFPEPDGPLSHASDGIIFTGYDQDVLFGRYSAHFLIIPKDGQSFEEFLPETAGVVMAAPFVLNIPLHILFIV